MYMYNKDQRTLVPISLVNWSSISRTLFFKVLFPITKILAQHTVLQFIQEVCPSQVSIDRSSEFHDTHAILKKNASFLCNDEGC